ncbi:uncharacterized protein [Physcomitrium patens]|uniref:Uncharacterized protein n=1 Tax=Physcomitrium patens TaxID=3218 RepID=A0A2K1K050_PHYPA|nr:uncharacterized protein LOC112287789 [Physcomitrium patens]PNR47152.1 hypothetical protein PHYPA_014272 [Physcomitrium patens]|eukprot:XP_024386960.1 uncharacterized protein LOC112287789 [Physcomitrella patens]
MASAALSMGRHTSLCTPPIGGSSLPSVSGFCGDCAPVIGSFEVSLSIDQRKLRLASVRALRRFQQSPFILSQSVSRTSSNNNLGTVRHLRFRASSGENQAVEGEEEKKEPANTTEKSTSSGTSNPSPFAAGKISSKIASQQSQQAENGKSSVSPATKEAAAVPTTTATDSPKSAPKPVSAATPSVFVKAPAAKPAFTVNPKSPLDDGSDSPFPTGKVSPFAADRLKSQMASPPSQYNRTSSGRTMINSGKQVLDAFKQGEKDGKTTKFGQPIVPKNIFDDVRQTQEEKDADKFSFNLRPGDIFLIFSFLLIIGLMLGTAFLVWKVGGIHYNE